MILHVEWAAQWEWFNATLDTRQAATLPEMCQKGSC